MKKLVLVFLSAILISAGCGVTVKATRAFDPAKARAALEASGQNTVNGSAMMRQQGGGVVTCAGFEVALIPVTEASTEIMQQIFKNTRQGFYRTAELIKVNFSSGREVLAVSRKDICDTGGKFSFDKVKDGSYYLLTHIKWVVPAGWTTAEQGGYLMKRVDVAGGNVYEEDIAPTDISGSTNSYMP